VSTNQRSGRRTTVFLLDRRPLENTGHYWAADKHIIMALSESGHNFDFISPSAQFMFSELGSFKHQNSCFTEISEMNFVQESFFHIRTQIDSRKLDRIIVFISWIPDLDKNELKLLSSLSERCEVSIVGISMQTPEAISGDPISEPYFGYKTASEIPNFKVLWVPDIEIRNSPLLTFQLRNWIDFQSFTPAGNEKRTNKVGFFGQLSGYRGLGEALILGLMNPKLRVFIRGSGFSMRTVWRPFKRKIYRYSNFKANPVFSLIFSFVSIGLSLLRHLPNIQFNPDPFSDEAQLNDSISKCNSIFICCKNRPGSGIVMKALASGVPVLWNGYEGNLFQILKAHYPEGQFNYYELFIPGRMRKKINTLKRPSPIVTWEAFRSEIELMLG
jgi:hypothetical protein